MVRIEGWWRDVLLGRNLRVPLLADPRNAFLLSRLAIVDVVFRFGQIDLSKERLMLLEIIPLFGVVEFSFVDEVQIEFARTDSALP